MRGTDRYISVSVGMGNIADRRTSSGEITATSFSTAATAGLRAMGAARRSLPVQLTASAAYVVGGSVGAVVGGALGASWGVIIAQVFSALLWWHQLRSALHVHHANPEIAR